MDWPLITTVGLIALIFIVAGLFGVYTWYNERPRRQQWPSRGIYHRIGTLRYGTTAGGHEQYRNLPNSAYSSRPSSASRRNHQQFRRTNPITIPNKHGRALLRRVSGSQTAGSSSRNSHSTSSRTSYGSSKKISAIGSYNERRSLDAVSENDEEANFPLYIYDMITTCSHPEDETYEQWKYNFEVLDYLYLNDRPRPINLVEPMLFNGNRDLESGIEGYDRIYTANIVKAFRLTHSWLDERCPSLATSDTPQQRSRRHTQPLADRFEEWWLAECPSPARVSPR